MEQWPIPIWGSAAWRPKWGRPCPAAPARFRGTEIRGVDKEEARASVSPPPPLPSCRFCEVLEWGWGRSLADLCCGGPEPAPAEPRSSSMRAWAGPAADLRASLPAHRVLLAEGACYVPSTLSPAECRRKRKKYLDQKKLVAAGQVARFLLDLVAFRQIRSSIHSTWPAVVFRASLLCSQTTPQRQLRHGLPTQ